ncbi:MAG: MSCRAMM family protein, partial [Planctomycetota bacterium]
MRVALGPPHGVRGRVLFADGSAVQGAEVHVLNPTLSPDELTIPMILPYAGPELPALRRYGSARSKEDGRFEVGDLPQGPYNLVAFWTDAKDSGGRGREVRAGARGVGTDAGDVVLRLPVPGSAAGPRVALEGSVTDEETGAPLLDFTTSVTDGSRAIRGEKTSLGRFRLETPPGTWTLRVYAEGFVESEHPGIELAQGVPPSPIEVALDRGARVRGVVRGPIGTLEDVVVVFREDGRTDGPRARLGKDGSYEATGFRPGRYWVGLETYRFRGEPSFAPSRPQELLVAEGDRALVLDIEAVPAGQLWVQVRSPRLAPPEWGERESTEEQRRNGAAARLEVRDGSGRIGGRWTN